MPRGDVGLRGLVCSGPRASCAIYVEDGDGFRHELAVEPVVGELTPAAENEPGGLRRGDVLVAVDGLLVTTLEGGRRLVDLVPGTPVDMVVRRDGDILQLTLTAGRGCGVRSLRVSSSRVSR